MIENKTSKIHRLASELVNFYFTNIVLFKEK